MAVFIMICAPVAAVLASWFLDPVWAWVIVMALLLAFVLLAGHEITKRWLGALIDERNKVSISRLQTTLWTVLVVSALMVAGINNVSIKADDPLNITVPAELWILLGISVTSLVGAGLIKQDKSTTKPDLPTAKIALSNAESAKGAAMKPADIREEGKSLVTGDVAAPTVMAEGVLTVNPSADKASWLDMFRAEEVGNVGRLDIGKIQVFYFTVLLLVVYGAALAMVFRGYDGKAITELPELSESMVALLGISHAAYLANKAVTRTQT